jgi:hypothetical protein
MQKLFMDTKKEIQALYKKLDNANGEQEIKPIMQTIQNYINALSHKEKERAELDFNYYFTRRLQKSEERIKKIEYEIKTENSIS